MKAILLIIAIIAAPASAQVYTWTDENGVKHFGSRPPDGQAHESVEIKDANRSAPPSKDLSRTFEQRARERRVEQATSGQRSSRVDYICTGAKDRLKSARERWDSVKTQGYTQSQKQYHEQRIREAERHRDNICR